MKRASWSDWLNYKKKRQEAIRRQCQMSEERMQAIVKHPATKRINYPIYREAYDYVDNLYPEANVKKVTIYECSKKVLSEVGLKGVGGCYNRLTGTVVISSDYDLSVVDEDEDEEKEKDNTWSTVVAEVTPDEVIVHELLHYVSLYRGGSSSSGIEEEFAYGNSIGYLRSRGRTDQEIAEKNFLPFFIVAADRRTIIVEALAEKGHDITEFKMMSDEKQKEVFKAIDQVVFEKTKVIAIENALHLIKMHSQSDSISDVVIDDKSDKFDMMDFGL